MERTLAALAPFAAADTPIIGLEPSCLFSFRDEIPSLLKSETARQVASHALLFEEFLAREAAAGKLNLPLAPTKKRALLHGHCHQKSFDTMADVTATLKLIPDLDVEPIESSCCGMAGAFGYHADTIPIIIFLHHFLLTAALKLIPDLAVEPIESSCCGMAGAFGYHADTIDVSRAMGELSLLPAVRKAPEDAIIVADGTSCRHQIKDGAGREAMHVARVLAMSLG